MTGVGNIPLFEAENIGTDPVVATVTVTPSNDETDPSSICEGSSDRVHDNGKSNSSGGRCPMLFSCVMVMLLYRLNLVQSLEVEIQVIHGY